MASTDNNTQYPANEIMITGNSGTVTASGSMVIVPATGNIGVGTTTPLTGFDVNVAAGFRQGLTIANGAVVSGSVNQSGGNVGIGTASSLGVTNVFAVYGTTNHVGNIVLQNASGQSGIFFADGSFQTTAGGSGGGGAYSNVNVASYLSGPVLVGNLYIGNSTASTSTVTGALIMNGGAGIAGNINVGGAQNNFNGNLNITTGNLNFTGLGQRITGDFTNATLASRVMIQTSTTNSFTVVSLIPNGSITSGAAATQLSLEDSSSIATGNGSVASVQMAQNTAMRLVSAIRGTGTYLPMAFLTSGSEQMRITTNGNLQVGATTQTVNPTATVVANNINGGGAEYVNNNNGGGNVSALSGGGLAWSTFTGTVGAEVTTERMRLDTNGNLIVRGAVGIGTSTAAGISTTSLSSNLYVWGNVIIANSATTSSAIIFPNGQTLSTGVFGPAGTIQVAGAGNSFTGDSSNFFWDNSNKRLGIGTATPAYQLSLFGTDYVLFNSRPGNAARQEITVGNVVSYGAVLGYDPSIPQSIGYLRRGDSAATSPAIAWSYVSTNYRVGINAVTQPQNAMEINGSLVIGNNYVGTAPLTNANGASIQGAVGIGTFTPSANLNNPLTIFANTGGGIELASGGAGGGGNIVALTSGGLKFSNFTGAIGSEIYTESMRNNSNGDLLVGITTPSAQLNKEVTIYGSSGIYSGVVMQNTTSGTGRNGLALYSAGPAGALGTWSNGSLTIFANNNSNQLFINTDSNVAVGTTTTTYGKFTVQRIPGASTSSDIVSSDGTQYTYINSNWASGSYNPYVQPGDHGIIFHNGSTETGQFVISQWSSIAKGLRINTSGNVTMANNLTVTGEVYAYYSDQRLKDNIEPISNAINIINSISGVYYNANDLAVELLREDKTARKVGVLAQEIQAVMPEVVRQAPFDIAPDGSSISGENYQTVQYDKLVPLLIQAVKEQSAKIAELEQRIRILEQNQ